MSYTSSIALSLLTLKLFLDIQSMFCGFFYPGFLFIQNAIILPLIMTFAVFQSVQCRLLFLECCWSLSIEVFNLIIIQQGVEVDPFGVSDRFIFSRRGGLS